MLRPSKYGSMIERDWKVVASLLINMEQILLRTEDFLLNPYFLLFQKNINGM